MDSQTARRRNSSVHTSPVISCTFCASLRLRLCDRRSRQASLMGMPNKTKDLLKKIIAQSGSRYGESIRSLLKIRKTPQVNHDPRRAGNKAALPLVGSRYSRQMLQPCIRETSRRRRGPLEGEDRGDPRDLEWPEEGSSPVPRRSVRDRLIHEGFDSASTVSTVVQLR